MNDTICTATIFGHMPRKSNSRRIVIRDNKPRSIKSRDALHWMDAASLQLRAATQTRNHPGPVSITAHIYYRSERSDLSDELLSDALERADIIRNDRQIVEKHLYRHVDRDNPRVEVVVEAIKKPPTP